MSDDDKDILRKAQELDDMERSVTSEEANVLERVLRAFSEDKRPKIKDLERLNAMYDKYLSTREESEDSEDGMGEEDIAEGEDNLEMLA